jgi:transmembrane sensor
MTDHQAEELIRKYAEQTASPEEVRQLMDWYQLAPVQETPWPSTHPDEKQQVNHRMLQRLCQGMVSHKKVLRFSWFRIAALLILVVGVALVVLLVSKPFSPSFVTVANSSGQLRTVQLPDGSTVWLNAASTLRYARAFKQSRALELEGEAYFDVIRDESHPFRVKAEGVETTVLGTTFTIKAYANDTVATVSVLSGRVKVGRGGKELAVLTPAMQLQVDRDGLRPRIASVDTAAVVAWKKGVLQFDGVPLADIAKVLERWYGVQIQFTNTSLQACRYYMSFDHSTSLENLLPTLAEITGVQYRIQQQNKVITLSGDACR